MIFGLAVKLRDRSHYIITFLDEQLYDERLFIVSGYNNMF